MQLDLLDSGAKRLGDRSLGFAFTRIRPGLLWIVASGVDDGRYGTRPLDELDRELQRLPLPTDFFVEATAVTGVGPAARTTWSSWLELQRECVRSLHLHTSARAVRLTVDVARHEARRASLVHAYTDREAFLRAFARFSEGADPPTIDVWEAPTIGLDIERSKRRWVVREPKCTTSLEHSSRGVVRVAIEGFDRGLCLDVVLDELGRIAEREPGLELFVDLSRADAPRPSVSHVWAAWFALHRSRIARVTLFAPTRAVHLTASIAQWLSRTGDLIRIVRDLDEFERAQSH